MDSETIQDVFRAVGLVRIRKMFGGHGVYHGEVMFALESEGELYLKVDGETVDRFRHLGSRPFAYTGRDGRTMTMSYWLMPESALDDPDEAAVLARFALEAAWRAKAAGTKKAAATKKRGKSSPRQKAEQSG
ncbi:TfoX/Sxy family protein [Microvirga alba]|uniref:TfoX/Sxy family protein n=1 Tax=Microvirga alba TaxID=2791025 RepID=A0A931BQ35_9HYPH|nr:TfoX/Sxy family protein [Microvirga alba]MBF9232488.1 TfoX/Sxy family protein [Microvirga alba]